MRQHKPSLEALQQAFAVTKLEPEIPDSTLSAYAADRATPVERDLVETMLEVDPSLADLIAAMRAELSVINEPLPVSVATEPLGRNSGWSKNWLRAWLPGVAAIVAVGACGALLLALSDRNRLLLDARAHDRQVAFAAEEERKNAKSLQQQIDSMQQELKASKSDKQQLVAKLNTARDALNREQAVQTKLAATTDGVESLVARALTR